MKDKKNEATKNGSKVFPRFCHSEDQSFCCCLFFHWTVGRMPSFLCVLIFTSVFGLQPSRQSSQTNFTLLSSTKFMNFRFLFQSVVHFSKTFLILSKLTAVLSFGALSQLFAHFPNILLTFSFFLFCLVNHSFAHFFNLMGFFSLIPNILHL